MSKLIPGIKQGPNGFYMQAVTDAGAVYEIPVTLPGRAYDFVLAHKWRVDENIVSHVEPCYNGCYVCQPKGN